MRKFLNEGFTLIELLVVVGILSVLIAGVLVTLNPIEQVKKGRDAQRKSDLSQLQRVLDAYNNDNNRYPQAVSWGDPWSPYMVRVPKDALTSQSYAYVAASDGSWYKLYARLERETKDPQVCSGGVCGPTNGCGGKPCNYGVSSSNTTP